MVRTTFYERLGMHRSSTEAEIAASWRNMSLSMHPDIAGEAGGPGAGDTVQSVAVRLARHLPVRGHHGRLHGLRGSVHPSG